MIDTAIQEERASKFDFRTARNPLQPDDVTRLLSANSFEIERAAREVVSQRIRERRRQVEGPNQSNTSQRRAHC